MPGLLERERRNKVVLALCNNPRCSQVFVQARAVGGRMQEQGCAGALQSSQASPMPDTLAIARSTTEHHTGHSRQGTTSKAARGRPNRANISDLDLGIKRALLQKVMSKTTQSLARHATCAISPKKGSCTRGAKKAAHGTWGSQQSDSLLKLWSQVDLGPFLGDLRPGK
eukprot:1148805-Pelagomonas_calceolata.AAC.1